MSSKTPLLALVALIALIAAGWFLLAPPDSDQNEDRTETLSLDGLGASRNEGTTTLLGDRGSNLTRQDAGITTTSGTQAAIEEAEPGDLRGRVVLRDTSEGVSGVRVLLTTRPPSRARLAGWVGDPERASRFSAALGEALLEPGNDLGTVHVTTTDANGEFAIDERYAGRWVTVEDPFFYVDGDPRRLWPSRSTIQVRAGARIAGRVSLGTSEEPPVWVLLEPGRSDRGFGGPGGRGGFRMLFEGQGDPTLSRRGTLADEKGAFAFDGLPADGQPYRVSVLVPGVGAEIRNPIEVTPRQEQFLDIAIDPGVSAQGLVRDREGQPIRGATIRAWYESEPRPEDANARNREDRGGRRGRGGIDFGRGMPNLNLGIEPVALVSATSDESGRFALPGMTDGTYRLAVEADGYVPVEGERLLISGGIYSPIELELRDAVRIRGVVRHPRGGRLANIEVAALEAPATEEEGEEEFGGFGGRGGRGGRGDRGAFFATIFGGNDALARTVTDRTGQFVLEGVPRRVNTLLEAHTDDGFIARLEVPPLRESPENVYELVLEPAPGIQISIGQPEGVEPPVEVELAIYPQNSPVPEKRQTIPAPDGRPILAMGLELGRYQVFLEAPGFAPLLLDAELTEEMPRAEILAELLPGCDLSGMVIERGTGVPIAEADVSVELPREPREGEGEQGPGGFGRGGFDLTARITAPRTRTDALGRFSLKDLPAGNLTVTVRHRDYPDSDRVEVALQPGQERKDLQLSLHPSAILEGLVRSEEGLPLAGTALRLELVASETSTNEEEGRGRRGGPFGGRERSTRTDENGRYVFEELPGGTYRVTLLENRRSSQDDEGEGRGRGRGRFGRADGEPVQSQTVELRPGDRQTLDFDLEPREVATLVATILDSGKAVREARGTLTATQGGTPWSANGDDQGRMRFENVPPGTYVLSVSTRSASTETTPPQERGGRQGRGGRGGERNTSTFALEITAPGLLEQTFQLPSGRIAGIVQAPTGPAANARVRLEPILSSSRESTSSMVAGPDGSFAFEKLSAGKYRLIAELAGGGRGGRGGRGGNGETEATPVTPSAPAIREIELGENEQRVGLAIALDAGGRLKFQVLDESGEPASGAFLMMRGSDALTSSLQEFGRTNREGEGTVDGLAAGTYSVIVSGRNLAATSGGLVQIVAGQEVTRTFRAARGFPLTLTITSGGEPVTNATVEVLSADGVVLGSYPNAGFGGRGNRGGRSLDGTYTLGTIAEGSYRVQITIDGETRTERIEHHGEAPQSLRL